MDTDICETLILFRLLHNKEMMWRVRVMKASDIRRALFILLLFCGGLMVYFLYQQPTAINIPTFSGPLAPLPKTDMKTDVRWTWECINQRCERVPKLGQSKVQSLMSCNMLCTEAQLWPLPTGPIRMGNKAVSFLYQQIQFESSAKEPALSFLEQSYTIFNENVGSLLQKPEYWMDRSDVARFRIKVVVAHGDQTKLRLATDESYNLTLNMKEGDLIGKIHASTVFGARHALETLSQLIWWDDLDSGSLKIVRDVHIRDFPRFPYRGIMIDTARNFMSPTSLKRVISAMAGNKLNVFHWHISDSQSFPLEIPSVPQMHEYGAYRSDMVYTVEEVKELVEYARIRGVRTVIEVDTPAHAGNGWTWGPKKGLGDLAVCVNAQPWYMYCGEPPCGQLNPENPNVYDVLEKIYKDILDMTQEDEIFHIGGDEVNLDCWEQHLYKNLTGTNYTDLHNLWGEFTLKILSRLERANGGKKIPYTITWSSNLSRRPYSVKYLDKKDIVVQSWGASDWFENRELLTDGYKMILSHVNAWYLDCGFGKWRERGEATCDPYRPWQTMYLHQPWGYDPVYRSQTLGAEVCLWSEQLDEVSLDTRLWPRAAAFAERMWSDPKIDVESYGIAESVYTRLSMHRERLISRGYAVEAMWPQYCTQNPGMCL